MQASMNKNCKINYPAGTTQLILSEFSTEEPLYTNRTDAMFDVWCKMYNYLGKLDLRMSTTGLFIKAREIEIDASCAFDFHIMMDIFTKLETYF